MKLIAIILSLCFFTNTSLSQESIIWSKLRKLEWKDFQDTPPSGKIKYKAISMIDIAYTFSRTSKSLKIQVLCTFNQKKSWSVTKDSIILLHEQTHFDIGEIFARKLRKAFSEYTYNPDKFTEDVNKIYENNQKEFRKWQIEYDSETNYSINKKKQLEWVIKVQNKLNELEKFAQI